MDNGWIKLHRKLQKWEWYQDSIAVHLFLHLLLSANHEDKQWQGVEVRRGQLITGRNSLSADTGITPQSIRTYLNKLKSTNEITTQSTNKYTIITISNYESYQIKEDKTNQQVNQQTNQQLTINQPATNHKQEYKELKNDKKEIVLPSIISKEDWNKWIEHRKKQKKPMTEYAKELAIKKLTRLNKEGYNPKDIINHSVENNYQGLYPDINKKPIQKNEFGY